LVDGGLVAGAQGQRKGRSRVDIDVGRVGKRVRGAAFADQCELVGDNVIGGAARGQQVVAGHYQRTGGGVISGAGDGGYGYVADGHAVAGGVGDVQRGGGARGPVFRRGQIVGAAAGGGRAVL